MTHYWFVTTKNKSSKLALVTFLLAFVVILLGAYTRLTDAGLSCPDWPHCYGYLTAPHTETQLKQATKYFPLMPVNINKAWTEMVHRYFAGIEGILILFLSFSILLNRKANDRQAVFISVALIFLLGIQVTLGMLTVTEKLKPIIVLSHLLTGLSILSVLFWCYINSKLTAPPIKKITNGMIPWFWVAFFILLAQITLGGWVTTHYAGLACVDFPYCNGELLPNLQWKNLDSDLTTIHMLHRIGAFLTASYLLLFSIFLFCKQSYRKIAGIILILISLQITLGILNIIWLRPVWIALTHHALAILLLLTLILSLIKVHYESKDRRYDFWTT